VPNNHEKELQKRVFYPWIVWRRSFGVKYSLLWFKEHQMSRPNVCIKCGTYQTLVKNGKAKAGTQRYKCRYCGKTFILNESTTKHLQVSDYCLKKFIGYMIDDVILEVISRNLSINI